MTKSALASRLRQCQRDLGAVPPELIDVLSDDQIIACYTTCNCCGDRLVDKQGLRRAIREATDEEHFLQLIADHSQAGRMAS